MIGPRLILIFYACVLATGQDQDTTQVISNSSMSTTVLEDDGFCQSTSLGNAANWTRHGDSCYLYVAQEVNANGARDTCRSMGARLTSISSSDEYNFVFNFSADINRENPFWIGLYRNTSESCPNNTNCTWMWSDGTPLSFTKWNPNKQHIEPSSCVLMEMPAGVWDGTLLCNAITHTKSPFVCEQDVAYLTTITEATTSLAQEDKFSSTKYVSEIATSQGLFSPPSEGYSSQGSTGDDLPLIIGCAAGGAVVIIIIVIVVVVVVVRTHRPKPRDHQPTEHVPQTQRNNYSFSIPGSYEDVELGSKNKAFDGETPSSTTDAHGAHGGDGGGGVTDKAGIPIYAQPNKAPSNRGEVTMQENHLYAPSGHV